MTSRYTHSRFYDLSAAVQGLPIPTGPSTGTTTLAATGTNGRQISLGPNLGPQQAKTGDFGGQTRTETRTAGSEANLGRNAANRMETNVLPIGESSVWQKRVRGIEPP